MNLCQYVEANEIKKYQQSLIVLLIYNKYIYII